MLRQFVLQGKRDRRSISARPGIAARRVGLPAHEPRFDSTLSRVWEYLLWESRSVPAMPETDLTSTMTSQLKAATPVILANGWAAQAKIDNARAQLATAPTPLPTAGRSR